MNRRGFLATILAAAVAPAICKAANLMPVFVRRDSGLLVPAHDGAVVRLYDAAGVQLAEIPMWAAPASQGRIWLSGEAAMRPGTYYRATLDVPGVFHGDVPVRLDTEQLVTGGRVHLDAVVERPWIL